MRVPSNDLESIFRVGNQIQYENGFDLKESQLSIPSINYSTNISSRSINFTWPQQKFAEYYDFEWCHIDNYAKDAAGKKTLNQLFSVANREYINQLKKSSARVSISDTTYELPIVFESGYVLVKVRAIGNGGQNHDQPIYGRWIENRIIIDSIPSAAAFSSDKMNWQYQAVFSDDGKRKDIVLFMDGTLRERQNSYTIKSVLKSEPGNKIS